MWNNNITPLDVHSYLGKRNSAAQVENDRSDNQHTIIQENNSMNKAIKNKNKPLESNNCTMYKTNLQKN